MKKNPALVCLDQDKSRHNKIIKNNFPLLKKIYYHHQYRL